MVNSWLERVYEKSDLFVKDVELSYIDNIKQRTFFKIVELWQSEVGDQKKGYKEFISSMVHSVSAFDVSRREDAYLKLFDCFPQGPHTGIRRVDPMKAFGQSRFADHELGEYIIKQMGLNACIPSNKLRDKVITIFGDYSIVYVAADNIMFWQRRLSGFQERYEYDHVKKYVDAPDPYSNK